MKYRRTSENNRADYDPVKVILQWKQTVARAGEGLTTAVNRFETWRGIQLSITKEQQPLVWYGSEALSVDSYYVICCLK